MNPTKVRVRINRKPADEFTGTAIEETTTHWLVTHEGNRTEGEWLPKSSRMVHISEYKSERQITEELCALMFGIAKA